MSRKGTTIDESTMLLLKIPEETNKMSAMAVPKRRLNEKALLMNFGVISFFCTIAEPIPVSAKLVKMTKTAVIAA